MKEKDSAWKIIWIAIWTHFDIKKKSWDYPSISGVYVELTLECVKKGFSQLQINSLQRKFIKDINNFIFTRHGILLKAEGYVSK